MWARARSRGSWPFRRSKTLILGELKDYLASNKRVAITDLANRFDVEPDALRGMLQAWIGKGRVRRIDPGCACCSCSGCGETAPEIYEWVG